MILLLCTTFDLDRASDTEYASYIPRTCVVFHHTLRTSIIISFGHAELKEQASEMSSAIHCWAPFRLQKESYLTHCGPFLSYSVIFKKEQRAPFIKNDISTTLFFLIFSSHSRNIHHLKRCSVLKSTQGRSSWLCLWPHT